ncbi:unnamed protein product [Urochloa humidicola]
MTKREAEDSYGGDATNGEADDSCSGQRSLPADYSTRGGAGGLPPHDPTISLYVEWCKWSIVLAETGLDGMKQSTSCCGFSSLRPCQWHWPEALSHEAAAPYQQLQGSMF